eukprot:gene8410-205_t
MPGLLDGCLGARPKLLVASHKLSVAVHKDPATGNWVVAPKKHHSKKLTDSAVEELRAKDGVDSIHIGTVGACVPPAEQEDLRTLLMQ